jgi:hypothetical protein
MAAAAFKQPLKRLFAAVNVQPQQILVYAAAAYAHPVASELLFVDNNAVFPLDFRADCCDMRPMGNQSAVFFEYDAF